MVRHMTVRCAGHAASACSRAAIVLLTGEVQVLTLAMTTRSFSLGLAATASPSFLYSGVRCLQCPHLRHAEHLCPGTPYSCC